MKDMLDILQQVERELGDLLLKDEEWDSLYIDYDHPNVERLYRSWEDYRINLHIIHNVPKGLEPLYHPHPWPSAMKVLAGKYKMAVGYGPYDEEDPPVAATIALANGSYYEMVDINAWHSVEPLTAGGPGKETWSCATLMITGKPWWDGWSPNDKELALGPLTDERKKEILDSFAYFYHPKKGRARPPSYWRK
jgi:hypothetical protein